MGPHHPCTPEAFNPSGCRFSDFPNVSVPAIWTETGGPLVEKTPGGSFPSGYGGPVGGVKIHSTSRDSIKDATVDKYASIEEIGQGGREGSPSGRGTVAALQTHRPANTALCLGVIGTAKMGRLLCSGGREAIGTGPGPSSRRLRSFPSEVRSILWRRDGHYSEHNIW